MTMNRRRRQRKQVRRIFTTGEGTSTAPTTVMIDITPQTELAALADRQNGNLTVTGVATCNTENAIHRLQVWTGRTSTQPAVEDQGVRTRDVPANPDGLPFVVRFNGLKLTPGELLKLNTFAVVEEDATATHTMVVTAKWAFTESAER